MPHIYLQTYVYIAIFHPRKMTELTVSSICHDRACGGRIQAV